MQPRGVQVGNSHCTPCLTLHPVQPAVACPDTWPRGVPWPNCHGWHHHGLLLGASAIASQNNEGISTAPFLVKLRSCACVLPGPSLHHSPAEPLHWPASTLLWPVVVEWHSHHSGTGHPMAQTSLLEQQSRPTGVDASSSAHLTPHLHKLSMPALQGWSQAHVQPIPVQSHSQMLN
eukprot:1157254-Pelagomonas_calceolata.AAC.3